VVTPRKEGKGEISHRKKPHPRIGKDKESSFIKNRRGFRTKRTSLRDKAQEGINLVRKARMRSGKGGGGGGDRARCVLGTITVKKERGDAEREKNCGY